MAKPLQVSGLGAAPKVIVSVVAVLHDAPAAGQRLGDNVKKIRPGPVGNGVQAATGQQCYRFQISILSVSKPTSVNPGDTLSRTLS
jgi:hypothetical protein